MIVDGVYMPDSLRPLFPEFTTDRYPSTDLLHEVKAMRNTPTPPTAAPNRAQRRARRRKS